MNTKTRQAMLLKVLNEQQEPLAVPALLGLLPAGEYSDRTLRRWLSRMVEDGRVIRTGQKRSTRYQLAENARPRTTARTDGPEVFSPRSHEAINYIKQPLFQRQPVS